MTNAIQSSPQLIGDAFARWEAGEFSAVTDLMADDLQWSIIGSTAISGSYNSRQAFLDAVNHTLLPVMKTRLQPKVDRILADGDTVAVFFTSHAETHSGPDYDQSYCWLLDVADGRIQRGRAYLDTALVDAVLTPGGGA